MSSFVWRQEYWMHNCCNEVHKILFHEIVIQQFQQIKERLACDIGQFDSVDLFRLKIIWSVNYLGLQYLLLLRLWN